jgi:hypothetical protein
MISATCCRPSTTVNAAIAIATTNWPSKSHTAGWACSDRVTSGASRSPGAGRQAASSWFGSWIASRRECAAPFACYCCYYCSSVGL